MPNAWARQVGASSAWFYSLAWIFLSSPERFLRGSDLDSARQTETCQYEPCVTSRPPFVKQSGSFDQTPCLWSSCSLPLSSSFHLSFFLVFFFFFTFLETGKVKPPPPPSPKRACPYFGKCGNLRTVPKIVPARVCPRVRHSSLHVHAVFLTCGWWKNTRDL